MDIFNLTPKFEVPVIEERVHSNKGSTHTEETRRKMSEAHKGKTLSEEHRRKISESVKTLSEESRRKISETHKGKAKSEEHRRKMSEVKRAKVLHLFYGKHPVDWAELLGNHASTVRYWKKKGILLQKLQERGYCLEEKE